MSNDTNQQTLQRKTNPVNLSIQKVLHEAWGLVNNSKWPIWIVLLAAGLITVIVVQVFHVIAKPDLTQPLSIGHQLIATIVLNAITAPFYAGAIMTAIKRTRGETVSIKTGYQYFHSALPLAITFIIVSLIAQIPNFIISSFASDPLSSAPSNWLAIMAEVVSLLIASLFILSLPLIADKHKSPTQAIVHSVYYVKHQWFKVFLLLCIAYILGIACLIPITLGRVLANPALILFGAMVSVVLLIWVVPFIFLIFGVIYHRLIDTIK